MYKSQINGTHLYNIIGIIVGADIDIQKSEINKECAMSFTLGFSKSTSIPTCYITVHRKHLDQVDKRGVAYSHQMANASKMYEVEFSLQNQPLHQ